jgi:hypothetical protein
LGRGLLWDLCGLAFGWAWSFVFERVRWVWVIFEASGSFALLRMTARTSNDKGNCNSKDEMRGLRFAQDDGVWWRWFRDGQRQDQKPR